MNDTSNTFDNIVDDYLIHSNVMGSHWYQHDPNRRWQSQAVYAKGMPNPDGKVRGGKKKELEKTSGRYASGSKSKAEQDEDYDDNPPITPTSGMHWRATKRDIEKARDAGLRAARKEASEKAFNQSVKKEFDAKAANKEAWALAEKKCQIIKHQR